MLLLKIKLYLSILDEHIRNALFVFVFLSNIKKINNIFNINFKEIEMQMLTVLNK